MTQRDRDPEVAKENRATYRERNFLEGKCAKCMLPRSQVSARFCEKHRLKHAEIALASYHKNYKPRSRKRR